MNGDPALAFLRHKTKCHDTKGEGGAKEAHKISDKSEEKIKDETRERD